MYRYLISDFFVRNFWNINFSFLFFLEIEDWMIFEDLEESSIFSFILSGFSDDVNNKRMTVIMNNEFQEFKNLISSKSKSRLQL